MAPIPATFSQALSSTLPVRRLGMACLVIGSLAIATAAAHPADRSRAQLVAIHDIQGPAGTSPRTGDWVSLRGIVTGLKSNGFFVQAPAAEWDGDPSTSEGIFVYTGSSLPDAARTGNLVQVNGRVTEYIPSADPWSLPMTEISGSPAVTLVLAGQALPPPAELTAADLSPAGGLEQLERYEGMRVRAAALTVVGPAGGWLNEAEAWATSDGVFYGVMPDSPRPFREPGIETPLPVPQPPCCIPRFDANPERLRVDGDGLAGTSARDLASGVLVTGLTGPLDFVDRSYTLLPQSGWVAGANPEFRAVQEPGPDEFTLATANLQRFFDDHNDPALSEPVLSAAAFQRRLAKTSRAIREVLRCPDLVGVQEVEDGDTLQRLADRINGDAVAAGGPSPGYQAFLLEGHDPGGIDVGCLARADRVTVLGWEQAGAEATYINPADGQPDILFDHPPLILEVRIASASRRAVDLRVAVNHLRSLIDIDDPDDGARVMAKRQAQAEFLAGWLQAGQAVEPEALIIALGDFNAFQFNDGYADVHGTARGAPAPADEVAIGRQADLVHPDYYSLLDQLTPGERYTYVYRGNAQAIDHLLVSRPLRQLLRRVEVARLNADFPASERNDGARPERAADHDWPLAAFSLAAPEWGDLDGNGLLEAADYAWMAEAMSENQPRPAGINFDLDFNGRVDPVDLVWLRRALARR